MNKLSVVKILELNDETKHIWTRTHYNELLYSGINAGETYVCLGLLESENKIFLLNHRNDIVGLYYNENIFIEII